ncbi:uncharacterized protein SPSC_04082 [Sporisorium scitamineum]|uniref:Uncharacterized protein n=1 Tax=Sporisorium scitamineum TaxID=49012 RepID=A0A0F7RSW1_9BASI|nr:hypothetical protein [Sporisorium scitamineum]CDU24581.1 uncharacterized protein SPSC_04082 [Sporisorium scitamineum]
MPADTWGSDNIPGGVVYGSPPPESHGHSSISSNSPNSSNDVEMHTPSTSHDSDEEVEAVVVMLVGRDGFGIPCSESDIRERSTVLFGRITWHGEQASVDLPLPKNEVRILADTINASPLLKGDYWQPYRLEDLVRALELYEFYDCHGWDFRGIETTILDRLQDTMEGSCVHDPRFDLNNARFARRLRALADYHDMAWLLLAIDKTVPAHINSTAYGDEDGERPRKWRKISSK